MSASHYHEAEWDSLGGDPWADEQAERRLEQQRGEEDDRDERLARFDDWLGSVSRRARGVA